MVKLFSLQNPLQGKVRQRFTMLILLPSKNREIGLHRGSVWKTVYKAPANDRRAGNTSRDDRMTDMTKSSVGYQDRSARNYVRSALRPPTSPQPYSYIRASDASDVGFAFIWHHDHSFFRQAKPRSDREHISAAELSAAVLDEHSFASQR